MFGRDGFFELLEISEWSFGEVRRIFWEHKALEWDLVPDIHKGWYSVGSMGKDFKLRVDLPNTIEGFWSNVKNGIRGVYHSVSTKYLQLYLNEYAFRYNNRNRVTPMFHLFLRQAIHPAFSGD
jgi:hypothetical protein